MMIIIIIIIIMIVINNDNGKSNNINYDCYFDMKSILIFETNSNDYSIG